MSAEPGTDKAARREKIVMALGIAAIVLFSANLLTMVARHFWPDLDLHSLFAGSSNPAVEEVETVTITGAHGMEHAVHVFVKRQGQEENVHRWVFRLNGEDVHVHARDAYREAADRIESDLRVEMDRLHRDIARQQSRLEADMNARPDVRMKRLREARIRAMKESERAANAETTIESEEQALDRALVELESELASIQRAVVVRKENQNR